MKAVIYAAKSTEDTHGSIPTQLDDCRALAERQGWEVAGEFTDEAFSAFKGNRGPGLARAKALAIQVAGEDGSAVLVAQDTDRFARGAGDKPGAADHLGELYFVMRRQGVKLWSFRTGEIDSIRAVLEGERGHDESERKSQSVRDGLKRRKDSGAPCGPIPFGYRVEDPEAKTSPRVVDEDAQATAEAMLKRVAGGATPGDVARWLNATGVRTRRGGTWAARSVRDWVRLAALVGEDGYPALIDRDLWERANGQLRRLDPVGVAGRSGGRPPVEDAFILRNVARCARCGRTLWTRSYESGRRAYVCASVREARGTCDAERIPAPEVERLVIEHLSEFVGTLDAWLADLAADSSDEQRRREAQIARDEAALADLRASRARHLAEYSKLVEAGDALATLALEPIRAIDEQIAATERTIADAQAARRGVGRRARSRGRRRNLRRAAGARGRTDRPSAGSPGGQRGAARRAQRHVAGLGPARRARPRRVQAAHAASAQARAVAQAPGAAGRRVPGPAYLAVDLRVGPTGIAPVVGCSAAHLPRGSELRGVLRKLVRRSSRARWRPIAVSSADHVPTPPRQVRLPDLRRGHLPRRNRWRRCGGASGSGVDRRASCLPSALDSRAARGTGRRGWRAAARVPGRSPPDAPVCTGSKASGRGARGARYWGCASQTRRIDCDAR
jgi:DNA invertase Pin-like site-specific DNA recombinase